MTMCAVQNIFDKCISEDEKLFRYAFVVEYIGTAYAGSQIQPAQKTIQSEVESVFAVLLNRPVKTYFSGRTDSGVHSKGQVVHFDSNKQLDTHKLVNSLNALLPSEISISAMTEVDRNFHAQKSAKFRWYRYKISNKIQRSVWDRESVHVRENLNVDAMNEAIGYLIGSHDFSAFRKPKTNNTATECVVYKAECFSSGDYINIDVIANRFLYNMVRIIVGTLIRIGKGEKAPSLIKDILASKDRTLAGPTVDPNGLTLMYIGYSSKYNNEECIINKEAHKDENLFRQAS